MKKIIIMKKLLFAAWFFLNALRLSAQADLGGTALMTPAIVGLNNTGLLTIDVSNFGFTDVTSGCAVVTISVPSTIANITGVNAATNGIWTIYFNGALPGSITLRNTLGALPADFVPYPIVLDVKGIAIGGPSTITAQIRLAGAIIQGGCIALGNLDNTNDDPTTSIQVQVALAVKLSSFTAVASDCNTLLKWTSQQETDNKDYQVEVSKDGRIYSTVGVVRGAGTSGASLSYSFTDKKPFDGYSFYRLKMIASNGHVEYSNVVTVNNKCKEKSVRIYPNPLVENQQFGVYISGYTGTLKGELMSMAGQLIQTFKLHNETNTLAIQGVTQGSYILRVTEISTGANESFKVVVIK